MKSLYSWDAEGNYIPGGNDVVPDDYVLKGRETFEEPKGLMPIKRVNGTWVGATPEEYQKAHPTVPVQPSESAQVMNELGLQVAILMGQVKKLSTSVNELGLQFAKSQTDNKTENGGN